MFLIAIAALIPPPPGWTPPEARGPGNLCGRAFHFALALGEIVRADWPGEVFLNDSFGTYRIATTDGEVVIQETGERARPRGPSAATRGASGFRRFASGDYALAVRGHALVKAIAVSFPTGAGRDAIRAVLRRIRTGSTDGLRCLSPEDR